MTTGAIIRDGVALKNSQVPAKLTVLSCLLRLSEIPRAPRPQTGVASVSHRPRKNNRVPAQFGILDRHAPSSPRRPALPRRHCLRRECPGPCAGGPTISIEEYNPKSTLRVPEHKLTRAKFPFIDVHPHQRDITPARLDQIVGEMDGLNMGLMIDHP